VEGTLYPFGHGLSYTDFAYDAVEVTPEKTHRQGTVSISCEITNKGDVAGKEIVQLYLQDEYTSVTNYVRKLRGFEHVSLEPGQTKTVGFTLNAKDLALVNKDDEWVVEPGDFKVMIGSSSDDIRISDGFKIVR
jgi:beta-glucosidase